MNLNLSLVAQAITFAAFIWFTVKFVWPPMLRAIEARQNTPRSTPSCVVRSSWYGPAQIAVT